MLSRYELSPKTSTLALTVTHYLPACSHVLRTRAPTLHHLLPSIRLSAVPLPLHPTPINLIPISSPYRLPGWIPPSLLLYSHSDYRAFLLLYIFIRLACFAHDVQVPLCTSDTTPLHHPLYPTLSTHLSGASAGSGLSGERPFDSFDIAANGLTG